MIVLEQVPAVLPIWEALAEVLRSLKCKYKVDFGVLHTEQFGVPQTRRRAILIANLNRDVKLPTPTHQRYRKDVAPIEGFLGSPSPGCPWRTPYRNVVASRLPRTTEPEAIRRPVVSVSRTSQPSRSQAR